jgi:ATP-dependent helicase/nuclease subunit B
VRGSFRESESIEAPLTLTLSPQAGRGSALHSPRGSPLALSTAALICGDSANPGSPACAGDDTMATAMALKPRVFNIPASAPFLPTLIRALMEDRLGLGFKPGADPLALAGATIYLPTRRACRLAQQMFLDVLKRDAAILPRIVPIGDVDEDELAFAEAATGDNAGEALDLPEALGGLDRAMPLAALILKWAGTIAPRERGQAPLVANNPATAFALAQDLARLMDDMATRQVSWDRLDKLVPDELD